MVYHLKGHIGLIERCFPGTVAVKVGVSCHEENNVHYIVDSTVPLVPEVL